MVLNGDLNADQKTQIDNYLNLEENPTKVIQLQKTLPLSHALNTGLKYIDTEIVSRIDPDDICNTNRVESTKLLFKNFNVDILGSNVLEVDSSNPNQYARIYPSSHKKIKKMMLWNNQIAHSSVSFRLDKIIEAGGYPDLYLQEDYGLWLKCLKQGFIFHNDKEFSVIMNVSGMHSRRSGVKFFLSEYKLLKLKIESKLYPTYLIIISFVFRLIYRFMPQYLKRLFFNSTRTKHTLSYSSDI